MKAKKLVLLLDVIVVAIITIAMMTGTVIKTSNLEPQKNLMAENTDLSFDLIASPEEARVKAGETVDITLSVKNIRIGEEGLNSVVGYLKYDENLFENVEIAAEKDAGWELEINQIKDHPMYGKFCIFTMKEGVAKDQDVVKLKMKLKSDLKPQTTKVYFTELASSNGEVEVPEEDRVVTIIIYEDGVPTPEPTPEPEPSKPVQTEDNKILVVIAIAVLTILLNILTFGKRENKSNKVLSTILVMVIGLSCAGIVSYAAENINVKEVLNKLSYKQSWLNSEKYLVTEENVSRIAPGTKVEEIKNKFNKEVIVTKDGKEVKNGTVVGTGMKVSVKNPSKVDAEGNYAYEISVYGDTNGDGKSNQVELTRIIRNVVDEKKWELTGVKFKSADLTVDNEISRKDVDTSVKYIVYGEMEIPEFDPVDAPTIEVVEGEFNEEDNYYTTDVKVKITEMAKNGIKTQYKVENSKGEITPYTEISRENGKTETVIELKKDEIYKVSAYTTGELGNRSEIPYLIVNGVFNNLREYTVEYYYKNLKNDEADIYEIDNEKTEKKYEEIGKVIDTYTDKKKPGYDLAVEKGNQGVEGLPLTINKNEKENVIKVYYKIHHYGIAYNPDGGHWENDENPNPETYTIETPTITVINPTKRGFEVTGWVNEDDPNDEPENPKTIPEGTTGDIRIKVIWKIINYNITYKNIEGSTVAEGEKRDTYTISDTPLTIYTPKKEGYTFEGWTLTKLNDEVITNGTESKTMVIEEGGIGHREYTARWEEIQEDEYTIRYTDTEGATIVNNKLNPVKYKTSQTPIEIHNLNNRDGFIFTGWTLVQINDEVQDNPGEPSKDTKIPLGQSGNLVYKANWKEAARYTIEGEIIGELSSHGEMDGVPQTVLEGNDAEDITITVDDGFRVGNVTVYNVINGTKEETGVAWQASKKNGYYLIRTIKNVNCDKKVEAEIVAMTEVAMIVAVPADDDDLAELPSLVDEQPVLNHVYATLEDAIKDAEMINDERDRNGLEGKVEIQILRNIDDVESNVIIHGNDVILDLNGKTITGNYSDDTVIKVQAGGSLQITDRSVEDNGAIINTEGLAIKAENESELTLGINEEDQEPSITTPLIQGKVNAIKIEDGGTFNLYDGLIRGQTGNAVDSNGTVNDTPHFYIAYNEQDPEDENARIEYLAVPADIVAMIGDNTYVTLEAAFTAADAMDNTNPIEIDLVRDYLLQNENDNLITIGENRKYVLDLNGHDLTDTTNNPMFTNNGDFTIIDSVAQNIDLNKLTTLKHNNNDEFYFVQKGDVLVPNNAYKVVANQINHGYVEIDLSDEPESKTSKLVINGIGYNRYTKIIVNESKETPESISINNRINGKQEFNLTGGKKYYLHILCKSSQYYDTDSHENLEPNFHTVLITDLRLNNKPLIKELAYTRGKITSGRTGQMIVGGENSKLTLRNVEISSDSKGLISSLGEVYVEKSKINNNILKYDYGNKILGLAIKYKNKLEVVGGYINGKVNEVIGTENENVPQEATMELKNTSIISISPADAGVSCSNAIINNSDIYQNLDTFLLNADGMTANTIGKVYSGTIKNAKMKKLITGRVLRNSNEVIAIYNSNDEENKDKLKLEDSSIIKELTNYESSIIEMKNNKLGNVTSFVMSNYGKIVFESGKAYGSISNYADLEVLGGTINASIQNTVNEQYVNRVYYPYSAGKLYIKGGKITKSISNSEGSFTNREYGNNMEAIKQEIIIGTKNDGNNTDISTETPTIEVKEEDVLAPNAINNTDGIVKFYDGQIIAKEGNIISGSFTELEEGTCLVSSKVNIQVGEQEKEFERVTLSKNEPVAQIAKSYGITIPSGINTTENESYYLFNRIEDAIASCPNNAGNASATTIEILRKVYQDEELNINTNKNIIIDLKGNVIAFCGGERGFVVDDGSKLVIKGTEGSSTICNVLTIKKYAPSGYKVINNHKLIVNNGELEIAEGVLVKGTGRTQDVTIIENNKNMKINGATINVSVDSSDRTYGKIDNKGNLTIDNENTIINGWTTINNNNSAKLTVKNGTIYSRDSSINNSDIATIEINGGTIKAPINSSSTAETCVEITSNLEGKITNTEPSSKIEVTGTQNSIPVVSKIETVGMVKANYANISSLNINNNYATINNSKIGGKITNNTENITKISNGEIDELTLSGTGKTEITKCKTNALTNENGITTINNNNEEAKPLTGNNYNKGTGSLTIENTKSYGCYICNQSTNNIILTNVCATKNIDAAEVYTYSSTKVENDSSGNIYINEGSIIGGSTESIPVSNTSSGNIYIGSEDVALNVESPKVVAQGNQAIKNSGTGTVFFNNGIIIGQQGNLTSGLVEQRTGYNMVNTELDNKLRNVANLEGKILAKVSIAKIETSKANVEGLSQDKFITKDGYYEFYDLQDAINAAKTNATIYLIMDVRLSATSDTLLINNDDNLTIDVAGYTLATGKDVTFNNSGKLTLTDSSTEKTGKIESSVGNLITNNANSTLTLDGVTIVSNSPNGTAEEPTKVIVNNGTINTLNNPIINLSKNHTTGIETTTAITLDNLTINGLRGGSWSGYNGTPYNIKAVNNIGSEKVTITNSYIKNSLVYNGENGKTELKESVLLESGVRNYGTEFRIKGSILMPGYSLNDGDGIVSVMNYGIENNSGEMIFENSENKVLIINSRKEHVSREPKGSIVNNGGNLTFNSGKILGPITNENGTVNIFDGEYSTDIINKKDAIFNILGGTFNQENKHINLNGREAVFNGGTSINGTITNEGILTIGNKENTIDVEKPSFNYSRCEFRNKEGGTFNFYDGTFTVSNIITDEISEIPENTNIVLTPEESGYNYKLSSNTPVAKIGSTPYYTLESAIDACASNVETTIDMQESVVLPEGHTLTIGSQKKVKLNLNNKSIYADYAKTKITAQDATILFTIEVNSALEITNNGDSTKGYIYSNGDVMISNKGMFKLSGGNLELLDVYGHYRKIFIINSGSGSMEMTGGIITNKSYGPYSLESTTCISASTKGHITLSGGTIHNYGIVQVLSAESSTNNNIYVTISGDFYSDANTYGMNSHCEVSYVTNRVKLEMSGGYIKSYMKPSLSGRPEGSGIKFTNSIVNITGGEIDGFIKVENTSQITVDETNSEINTTIRKLESVGSTKIYGGTFTGSLSIGKSGAIINGALGQRPSEKVKLKGGLNIINGTTVKNIEMTESKGITSYTTQDSGTALSTIGEGVDVKVSGNALVGTGVRVLDGAVIESLNGIGLNVTGNIHLGTDDSGIDTTKPIIKGKTIGINIAKTGTLNWNDGRGVSPNTAYSVETGGTLIIPERFRDFYGVRTITEDSNKVAYIGPNTAVTTEAKIGDQTFNKLAGPGGAVDYINLGSKQGTITIVDTIILDNTLVIPSGCNITIDLQGNSIGVSVENPLIEVEAGATLTITDSTGTGRIQNLGGVTIKNEGTLNVQIDRTKIITYEGGTAITGNGTTNYNN